MPAGAPAVLTPDDEADETADDNGLASGCGVGLAGADVVGVVVGLADAPCIGDFDGVFDAVGLHVL